MSSGLDLIKFVTEYLYVDSLYVCTCLLQND